MEWFLWVVTGGSRERIGGDKKEFPEKIQEKDIVGEENGMNKGTAVWK